MSGWTVPPISRRHFIQGATLTVSAAWISTVLSEKRSAQEINDAEKMRASGASASISVETLRRNSNVLLGSGGNIAVLSGRDGKLLVDAGFATSQKQISGVLDQINIDPVRHLISTHWHFDHTDGNEWVHEAGATIIGHENTRVRFSARQEIPEFNGIFPPSPLGARPTVLFSNEKSLEVNGETLQLQHYAPAHSDSDISVRFLQANILHTGDTWFNGVYPFIDYHNGGSLDGMLAASARNLQMSNSQTLIVPGHGPVGNKMQLAEYDSMLRDVRDKVASLKKQGRSIQETIAACPSSIYDAKWGVGLVPSAAFVALVYAGVR